LGKKLKSPQSLPEVLRGLVIKEMSEELEFDVEF
jgi:hypothetical protein